MKVTIYNEDKDVVCSFTSIEAFVEHYQEDSKTNDLTTLIKTFVENDYCVIFD